MRREESRGKLSGSENWTKNRCTLHAHLWKRGSYCHRRLIIKPLFKSSLLRHVPTLLLCFLSRSFLSFLSLLTPQQWLGTGTCAVDSVFFILVLEGETWGVQGWMGKTAQPGASSVYKILWDSSFLRTSWFGARREYLSFEGEEGKLRSG